MVSWDQSHSAHIVQRPTANFSDLLFRYIQFCFSIAYRCPSKAAIIRFTMILMSNSGQLASSKKTLEHANKLQDRKPVQAIAYCLIIANLITFFSIASCFLLEMTHIHIINRLPWCFFVWRPERRCSSFSLFSIFRGSYESRDWRKKTVMVKQQGTAESYFNYCNSGWMNQELVDANAGALYWKSDKMLATSGLNPIPYSEALSIHNRNI